MAVPEAAVDRGLGGPERRERLFALVDVVDLRTHHPGQQAAPPMRRQHADDRDAGAWHRPARNGHLEREHPCPADDLLAVEGRVHPLGGKHLREALGLLTRRHPTEVVADRARRLAELVQRAARSNAIGHPCSSLRAVYCCGPADSTTATQNPSGQYGGSGVAKSAVARASPPGRSSRARPAAARRSNEKAPR